MSFKTHFKTILWYGLGLVKIATGPRLILSTTFLRHDDKETWRGEKKKKMGRRKDRKIQERPELRNNEEE